MRLPPLSLGTKMGLVAGLVLSGAVAGLTHARLSPWIALLLVLLLTLAVLLLLCRWYVDRPIEELIRTISTASSRDFLIRASVRSRDAIGRLAESFNRLLERITTLDAFKMETERQLIVAQEELKYKEALEEKGRIIEKTNRELEARLKELSLLYDFSQKISMTLELDELGNILDSFLGETLGFREFAFLVLDEGSRNLVVKVARGFPDEAKVRGMSFTKGEGITGRVLARGEPISISDTGLDPNYLYYKGEKREDGSFLSLPLLFKQKVVGALNLFRPGRNRFSREEIHFLTTLSVELAIALVNARLYSRTRELSVRDELTQLYNRRHFQEVLPLEIKRAQRFGRPLALLMIDLDFFKNFNDRYGHLAGDECLKEFVHLVGSKIREVDFFARFGGEEFVIILPGTPKRDGHLVAEKIRTLVREHRFACAASSEPSNTSLTVSIGVASYPDDAKAMEELVDAADTALYAAKRGGRDRVEVYAL